MPFSHLGLRDDLLRAVKEAGYLQPTAIQSHAIPAILTGKDLIGTAQTGTGKTAAFVLPLLERLGHSTGRCRALILAPTRELAQQVEKSIHIYGRFLHFSSLAVFGGISQAAQEKALRKGIDIIVATPGRLLDLARQGLVPWSGIELLVLDEADRMMDMGFLPDIRKVVKYLPQPRQTLLFSATMPPEIRDLAHSIQKEAVLLDVGITTTPVASVEQQLLPVPTRQKSQLLLHLLGREQIDTLLVFTRTKHGADRLHQILERQKFKAARLHSGRTQSQRQQALEGFRNRQYQILIATDIAARGIDVPNISHVLNYDIPRTADDYIHRIGRTGRAEKLGMAYTFVSPEDEPAARILEKAFARKLQRIRLEDFSYDLSPKLDGVLAGEAAHPRAESFHPQGQKPFPPRQSHRQPMTKHRTGQRSASGPIPLAKRSFRRFAAQEDYASRLLDSLAAECPGRKNQFVKSQTHGGTFKRNFPPR
jgi:ATP-dependent RNA helicase RhlE